MEGANRIFAGSRLFILGLRTAAHFSTIHFCPRLSAGENGAGNPLENPLCVLVSA
jgi:hypothetical protein